MASPINPRAARFADFMAHSNRRTSIQPAHNPLASHQWNSVTNPKFIDNAFPVLHGEPTINDSQRESLWDLFHSSRDVGDLAAQLPPGLHPDFVKNFLQAKSKPSVQMDTADKIFEAMQKISPEALDIAERHPHVLGVLMGHLKQGSEE